MPQSTECLCCGQPSVRREDGAYYCAWCGPVCFLNDDEESPPDYDTGWDEADLDERE
jgi:uncharacterized Zn finger protein (UPF0148 family)